MILVFGGTTEGRKAVGVLEEAGTFYYYSTRGNEQEVELVHGQRLTGGMDSHEVLAFCREHDIRLLVDAAHPFAEELHRNLLEVAGHVGAAIVRYERIYPPHTEDVVWCRDYEDAQRQLEVHGIERLLALTGVKTISRLKNYWSRHQCWFRILDRSYSRQLASKNHFPENHLVYYEHDDTSQLISQLSPQAILTKESGVSGGFLEKVEAAKGAGVKIFAIERPVYPPHTPVTHQVNIETVNGPHGLRRAVERLLPAFFPLHSGLTTGTCATAASVAAVHRLRTGETPSEVPVVLPDGETISVAVGYEDGYAYCIKEAGDDPDVTNGVKVRAVAEPSDHFEIRGGEGVGRFTLPGFDYPPGEAAINKGPRQMLRNNITGEYILTISVEGGAEIARRTFNPRLGIEGGISIIGVSGIVKPFSEEAFIESIRKCMQVAKASGASRVVIGSGAKSENTLRACYPDLPPQAFVQYGNYIGETLKMADELGFSQVTLGVMLGKAVKLAEGHLDTHSRRVVMNKNFIQQMLNEVASLSGMAMELIVPAVHQMTLARELWDVIPHECIGDFCQVVLRHCLKHCQPLVPHAQLTLILIDEAGDIHSL